MPTDFLLVLTSSDDRKILEQIASSLVKHRLAACCRISQKLTSIYRWKEKIESSEEWTLSVKTTSRVYDLVEEQINSAHNYDLPEIVAIEIKQGSKEYLGWISGELG